MVYGNLALRPMGDLDLLVRASDLSPAVERLQETGYRASRPFWLETERATNKHLPPLARPGAIPIELHWAIESPTSPFRIDVEGLWERSRPATLAGVSARVLSPEDLLLHLCLHTAFRDLFAGLRPFCDLAAALHRYQEEIDWEQLQQRAHQWRAGPCVYLTLLLARDLLTAPVPEAVLAALQPAQFDPQVATWAWEQTFLDRTASPALTPHLARLGGSGRLSGKAALFLKSVFPSPQVMAHRYPVPPDSWRIYLYYPVRWKDLLRRHGRAAWRLLRREAEVVTRAERESNLRDWLGSA